jgi:hypothetical protein
MRVFAPLGLASCIFAEANAVICTHANSGQIKLPKGAVRVLMHRNAFCGYFFFDKPLMLGALFRSNCPAVEVSTAMHAHT